MYYIYAKKKPIEEEASEGESFPKAEAKAKCQSKCYCQSYATKNKIPQEND